MTQLTVLNPKNISENKLTLSKWTSSCCLSFSCPLLHFSSLISHVSLPNFPLFCCSPYLHLQSHPLSYAFSLSISKGQMFPAVTVALHWYSALNLAKSQTAVSASSNHTAIWHTEHTEREEEKAWRIKGTEKYERQRDSKKERDRQTCMAVQQCCADL